MGGGFTITQEVHVNLLQRFRLLAAATHSSGNSRHASHRRPHDVVAAHCPRPSHPPADELAQAMLDVAPLFPAQAQVLLQTWINNCYCYAIKELPNSLPISLKNLEIGNCEALKSLPKNDLPSPILELHVLL